MLIAHRKCSDDPDRGRQLRDDAGGEGLVHRCDEKRVLVLGAGEDFRLAHRMVVGIEFAPDSLGKAGFDLLRQASGDQKAR